MAGSIARGRMTLARHYSKRNGMATHAGYSWTIATLPCVNIQMIPFCHTNAMTQRVA